MYSMQEIKITSNMASKSRFATEFSPPSLSNKTSHTSSLKIPNQNTTTTVKF